MKYYYTGTGQKLMVEIFDGTATTATTTKTRYYLGGLVMKGSKVEFINTPEGRAIPKASIWTNPNGTLVSPPGATSTWTYEYQLKDHLGNLRVACRCGDPKRNTNNGNIQANANREPTKAVQTEDYDAWGLSFGSNQTPPPGAGGLNHRYLYNGKEQVQDLNIGLYEYGFRWYDTQIAKFVQVDPLADEYSYKSTYDYAENTPIQAIDLDGLEAFFVHGTMSNPSRWNDGKNAKHLNKGSQSLFKLSGNRTFNSTFKWGNKIKWGNGFTNNENDREKAAQKLANFAFNNRKDGEDITFIGHSHGGNVSIQAVPLLRKLLDKNKLNNVKINIITVSTPVDNNPNSSENPKTFESIINRHIHLYNRIDGIQTYAANSMDFLRISFYLKKFDREYENNFTQNFEFDVSSYYQNKYRFPETTLTDRVDAHSFDINTNVIKEKMDKNKLTPIK